MAVALSNSSADISGESILRLPQVLARTGLSRSSIYAMIRSGAFPKQVSLGPRAIGFRRSAVDAWIDARMPSFVVNLHEVGHD